MSPQDPGPRWRVVTLAGVRLELPSEHPEVVLQESEAPWRQLRMPVGMAEGRALAYAFRGIPTPRPLTHQLLADLLDRHGVDVSALRITERSGTTYLAELDTIGPRGQHTVSCRPSDGLCLVLRRSLPTPVLVAESLLDPGAASAEPGHTAGKKPADSEPEPSPLPGEG
jgi:bifunctional DNase/RNase